MNHQKVTDYQRKKLVRLIREVSELHGGEPEFDPHTGEVLGDVWLADYIAEVCSQWSGRLLEAITCFEDLKKQAEFLKR